MDAPDEAGPEQGAVGGPSYPPGLRGDLSRLFSAQGTHAGRPTMFEAVERAVTRPGPLAIVLYRGSHRLWRRGHTTAAELVWRGDLFLSRGGNHPGAGERGGRG